MKSLINNPTQALLPVLAQGVWGVCQETQHVMQNSCRTFSLDHYQHDNTHIRVPLRRHELDLWWSYR